MNDSQILLVAGAVREAAEALMEGGNYGMGGYDPDLEGCCGDVSIVLATLLGEKVVKIQQGKFMGSNHVWTRVKKTGFILDLTATQFGEYPRIFHVPPFTQESAKFCLFGDLTLRSAKKGWGDEDWRMMLEEDAYKLLED